MSDAATAVLPSSASQAADRKRRSLTPHDRQSFQCCPSNRTGLATRLNELTHVENSTKSPSGRGAGLGGTGAERRAADRNCSFSVSVSRAMNGFQLRQFAVEIEQLQVVFQQRPIERHTLVTRRIADSLPAAGINFKNAVEPLIFIDDH